MGRWIRLYTAQGAHWTREVDPRELDDGSLIWTTSPSSVEPVAADEETYGDDYVPGLKKLATRGNSEEINTGRRSRQARANAILYRQRVFAAPGEKVELCNMLSCHGIVFACPARLQDQITPQRLSLSPALNLRC